MNKVLRVFIPHITVPILDDVPIKGCKKEEKNEELDEVVADNSQLTISRIVRRYYQG